MTDWVRVLCVVAVAACSKERATPTPAVDAASSAEWRLEDVPKDLTPPPDPKPIDTLPRTWTDPAVVRRLAGDCAYAPRRFEDMPGFIGDLSTNRFWCEYHGEVRAGGPPTPSNVCEPYAYACELRCEGGCRTCDGVCTDACTKCKAPCADDACRTACATTCAECKESCTTKWERCLEPDCAKTREACAVRLGAQWDRSSCATKCATWKTCSAACAATDGICLEKCAAALSPTLAACTKKCEYIASPEHEVCELKCYESAPCAPALCRSPPK